MMIRDDPCKDNYEDGNDEDVDLSLLCRIFLFVWIFKANVVVGAIWCLMLHYGISHAEHKPSHGIFT